jgi:hypothetical protein
VGIGEVRATILRAASAVEQAARALRNAHASLDETAGLTRSVTQGTSHPKVLSALGLLAEAADLAETIVSNRPPASSC